MDRILSVFENQFSIEVIATLGFFFLLFLIRHFIVRAVVRLNFKDVSRKRTWIQSVKNLSLIVIAIVFFMMWGDELRDLALSVAAVAVAIVIALREVILCIVGGLIKAITQQFEVGDRVMVSGMRGEVIEHNLFSTTLFEIGPDRTSNQLTGRTIKIPNSVFVTESIYVIPKGEHYNLQVLVLPAKFDDQLFKRQEILLKSAQTVCQPYFKLAEEYMIEKCKRRGVELPNLKPRALYEIKSPTEVHFHVRMPIPFKRQTRTKNKIVDMYLAECFKQGIVN